MRLQRYIAMCGITSRRKAEDLITDGRVKVDGRVVRELGTRVNKTKNKVQVDDKYIKIEEKDIYILLNKPIGYVTTVSDEHKRKTVMDLISGIDERIYPVGRLDVDTSGLLLLTNDGKLTHKLTHPSYEVEKTYIALVEGRPSEHSLEKFAKGLKIEDYVTSPCSVDLMSSENRESTLKITIHEGRNRQVRKMCAAIGHPVIKLKRVSLGNVGLNGLELGSWRNLTKEELEYLEKL